MNRGSQKSTLRQADDIDPQLGRQRVIIERVQPEINCGRFPIKRIVGDTVQVEADIFADGHEVLAAMLLHRKETDPDWTESPMDLLVNDRWRGSFVVSDIGRYLYTILGWVDEFRTWRADFTKKVAADQDVSVQFLIGAQIVERAEEKALPPDDARLAEIAGSLRSTSVAAEVKTALALDGGLTRLMGQYSERKSPARYSRELTVEVDREKARFSTWYEMFPRSCSSQPHKHGTFRDCEERLPYLASMGFDVLYFPPIHPVGHTHRKGRNNLPHPEPGDPGSPWAVGSEAGGHKDIEPQLGMLEDLLRLKEKAAEHGIEIALDLSFQCSPDHPYVREHPEWFRRRPDGTIQYAENPPKKYEDIYPLDFQTEAWPELWQELKSIVLYWIDHGFRIFRVDNPHTKPFGFWEWLLRGIKETYPDVIFLSEAFTRPKIMYRLAKLGFTQSYTYFAWRNSKWDLQQYFQELNNTEVSEFFRPNLWPNTPDILTEYLQSGGRPAFMIRLLLAATLSPSYGIYGAAFELCENIPRAAGSEEYLFSEKYEIKDWDLENAESLRDLIGTVNAIRRENRSMQSGLLRFHEVDNEFVLCYSRSMANKANTLLFVVNLDYSYVQSGWVNIPLDTLGIDASEPYVIEDLLSGARYVWHGPRNYVELNPHVMPAHIFRITP